MADIVQPLHKDGEVCKKCGSDGGQHFGSCEDHPNNVYLRNKGNPNREEGLGAGSGGGPWHTASEGGIGFAGNSGARTPWLSGTEMKVNEEFMKAALTAHTGSKVASVKFLRGSFVVVFE